jgi:hypothetical protein
VRLGEVNIRHHLYVLLGESKVFILSDLAHSSKGFGLTIGSDISILFVNHKQYDSLGVIKSGLRADVIHGTFTALNVSDSTTQPSFAGTFGFINATNSHVSRGWFLFFAPYLSI